MKWAFSFTGVEMVFIIIFIALYVSFIWRVFSVAKRLGVAYMTVLPKAILRTVYFALLCVALLGPGFGVIKQEVKSIGKDIFVCLDLSQSMNATDIQPSRLEKVKFELKNLINAFPTDRIGLIMFSSESYVQCPLTYDNNALGLFIQTLSTNMVPSYGTDFGPPLEMALTKLTDNDSILARAKSKIIILISDGEDFGEDTENIVEEIRNEGIKLFTLGVGTDQGSKIPTKAGFKTDKQGNVVVSKLNTSSLESIAKDTDGEYFEINESKNDLKRLIKTINDIRGDVRESRQVDSTQNRYYYFLGTALLLMLVDIMLGVKLIRI